MNSIDIDQVFALVARTETKIHSTAIKSAVNISDEVWQNISDILVDFLLKDEDTPMHLRALALEGTTDIWLASMEAMKNQHLDVEYREKMKKVGTQTEEFFLLYAQQMQRLQRLSALINQYTEKQSEPSKSKPKKPNR